MVPSSPPSNAALKRGLRASALARRAAMGIEARRAAAEAAAEHGLAAIEAVLGALAGRTIALFAPFRDEIDTAPLAEGLRAKGARLALPVILARDAPLIFRRWDAGDALVAQGAYGIPTPSPDAPERVPEAVIVPLAAFDRAGARIGYGAGFYDRTLAGLRARGPLTAIGYAFACQEVDEIPAEPHDAPLDLMVTERGVFSCPGP